MTGPLGSRALHTIAPRDLSAAIILTTFPEVGSAADQSGFQAVASEAQLARYGMDCYGYALLAAGQVDLVVEAGLQSYDIQAPIAALRMRADGRWPLQTVKSTRRRWKSYKNIDHKVNFALKV